MHLMMSSEAGSAKRRYTLKKFLQGEGITQSAHPARFSPDDKYSKYRNAIRRRYGRLQKGNKTGIKVEGH
ncbi:hypothetical protein OQA88_4451 [Cercophora sp. LCS_1]